jgi:DNA-binding CsgD family transcriptional regulator
VREADVRSMLAFVSELAALDDHERFRAGVLPGLRELVACEIATYNEVEFSASRMIAVEDPPGSLIDGGAEIFIRLGEQNPLVTRYQRTRDGRPYRWSDVTTMREIRATELYRTAYEPMGVKHQLAFALPTPPELIIAFALNRGSRNFTERERQLLNLIRPPLIQAYRTVERHVAVRERLAAFERGLRHTGTGVVTLEHGPHGLEAGHATDDAAQAIGIDPGGGALPAALRHWAEERLARDGRAAAAAPLVLEGSGSAGTSVVHALPGRRAGEPDVLLVERLGQRLSTADLRAAGLTARQAEVLRLVALGRSNAEIARELGISSRTVDKHLERTYEQLGATSRVQAALTAWSMVRADGFRGDGEREPDTTRP